MRLLFDSAAVLVTSTLYLLKANAKEPVAERPPKSPLSKRARQKQKKKKHEAVKHGSGSQSPAPPPKKQILLPSVSFDSDDESDDDKMSTSPQHTNASVEGTSQDAAAKKKAKKKKARKKKKKGAGGEASDSGTDGELGAGADTDGGWETVTKKHKKKSAETTNGGVKQGLDAITDAAEKDGESGE